MLTDTGIERLRAAVLGRAFKDLGHKGKTLQAKAIREDARRFFEEGWYTAWSDRDLSRYYRMYREMIEEKEQKEKEDPRGKNADLRLYMARFPRVTMKMLAKRVGLSQSSMTNNFREEMTPAEKDLYMELIKKIREEIQKCMKKK